MDYYSLKPPHLLTISITIFLISTSYAQQQINEDFRQCSRSFNCGNLTNLPYPFWGDGRPQHCGRQGFELHCPSDQTQYPKVNISSREFQVLDVQAQNSLMRIVRTDMFNVCNYESLTNITLDYNLFDYVNGSDYMVNLWFNCSEVSDRAWGNFVFACTGQESVNYFVEEGLLKSLSGAPRCAKTVKVPMLRTEFSLAIYRLVTLQDAVSEGFYVQYDQQAQRDCSECAGSGGICGSNRNGGLFSCFCHDGPHSRICQEAQHHRGSRTRKLILGLVFAAIGVGLCIMSFIIIFYLRGKKIISLQFWGKRKKYEQDLNTMIAHCIPHPLRRYSFKDVKKMTCSFRDKLGQGGYGGVYKGKLPSDDQLVAVKVLNPSKGQGEEFINEVASISRTSHVNIVGLLGYCLDGRKRALIYEFMPNGSLEKFIYYDNNKLAWEILYQISVGIARGLEYLHRGCNTKILHFDIKPHNILLDENFCPKISDFGLAKLCMTKESIVSMLEARGTIGYIAPEVFNKNFGEVSHKSDVYSYGMMIIEMVGKRKNIDVGVSDTSEIYFPKCIYNQLRVGEDINLPGVVTKEDNEIVRKMLIVGLWCIQTIPSDRPSIRKVIEMLEGSMEVLQLPQKPSMSSPKRSLVVSSSSTS